ncbi:hypothetical protein GCM10011376_00450 [Nocardioides flavus (ex Wang et al. 2016)]|uniref:RNA-binding protein n=1 Tax=Nocardioides flavus (ex Wang et al. 2016) TaxID=2058780 RepID=A0ABQ3HHT2_9ACTN|nr:hypothetical protein [Nocardioides flavus (ex Wang et al. 2016)]GHE14884.1 hypothetical protein GCM10011376_00450 [Nocardioides flavus (ex Wang et al. 2016)]
MGLTHPRDLVAWQRWQKSRHRLRQVRHAVRPGTAPQPERFVLTTYDPEPRLLVALDSSSPTSLAALVEPLAHLDVPLAVLSPGPAPDLGGRRPLAQQDVSADLPAVLRGIGVVVSLGHYLPRGERAHQWARDLGAQSIVVQHGALTPYAPPLPHGARLLAWSDADADFWRSGRTDVDHEVVGSQLLWRAGLVTGGGAPSSTSGGADTRLTYLGQGHAAELSRARLVHAAASFCRSQGAVYRPHPSEHDRLSRLTHDAFRRRGITVDGTTPLAELTGPVVSVFSTGVLEAAAQGRDAWVDFPRPPAWLGEFWERYGMHRAGSSPTPAPPRQAVEPARNIAAILATV